MKRFSSAKVLSSVFLSSTVVSLTAGAVDNSMLPSNYSKNFTDSYLNSLSSALFKSSLKSNQIFLNTLIVLLISSFLVLKIKFAMTNFLNKEKLANEKNMKRIVKELEDMKKLLKDAVSYIDKSDEKALKFEDGNNKDTENKKLIEKVKQVKINTETFKAQCKKLMKKLRKLAGKVNSLAVSDSDCSFFDENRIGIEDLNIFIYKLCCKIKGVKGSYDIRNDISKVLAFNYGDDVSLSNKLLLNFELIDPNDDYNNLLTKGNVDNFNVTRSLNAGSDLNNAKNMADFLAQKVNHFLGESNPGANQNSLLLRFYHLCKENM